MPNRAPSHRTSPGRQAADANYAFAREFDPAALRAHKSRHNRRWRKVRALVLAANPLCADPYGVHAAAGVPVVGRDVDHVVKLQDAPERAYDLSNLQVLCSFCHSKKTRSGA